MTRVRHAARILCALAVTSLAVAGCGGAAPTDTTASATPGAATDGTTVAGTTTPADGSVPGATDPALGGDSATSALTQTVPTLSGGDLSGGLSSVDSTPLFDARAKQGVADDSSDTSAAETSSSTETKSTTPVSTTTYTGAKVYVDGITYSVNRNATFPKNNPVFRLLSVDGSTIEIELIAGEFTADGGSGTFLDKGDLVSFVNASEQVTYKVKYLRPITQTSNPGF